MEHYKEIVKFLIDHKNGLFITNRRAGKTMALLELLNANPYMNIITFNCNAKYLLIEKYKEIYNCDPLDSIKCEKEASEDDYEYAYIDEYFMFDVLPKRFLGAVGTMNFPIKIKSFMDSNITKEQIKLDAIFNLEEKNYDKN